MIGQSDQDRPNQTDEPKNAPVKSSDEDIKDFILVDEDPLAPNSNRSAPNKQQSTPIKPIQPQPEKPTPAQNQHPVQPKPTNPTGIRGRSPPKLQAQNSNPKEPDPLFQCFKHSAYYPFILASKALDFRGCFLYEPLLAERVSAVMHVTDFGFIINLDFESKRVLYNEDYFIIPHACVDEIRYSNGTMNLMGNFKYDESLDCMEISTKDSRLICLLFQKIELNNFRHLKEICARYNNMENLFGFHFKNVMGKKYRSDYSFDILEEYYRQGVRFGPLNQSQHHLSYQHYAQKLGIKNDSERPDPIPGPNEFLVLENNSKNGLVCSTYPEYLMIPLAMKRSHIESVSEFRSKERIPALSYHWANKRSNLWRGSQCKPGISNSRNTADEFMIALMHNTSVYKSIDEMLTSNARGKIRDVHLYDARDKLAAFGNMLSGKGSENPSYYKNCDISFNNIPNMHTIQASFVRLSSGIKNLEGGTAHEKIYKGDWLENIALILQLTKKIVDSMNQGISAFVHCSDGWDRTAQVAALVQLAIDPYFRTTKGFLVLIQKEFTLFGHQFSKRNKIGKFDNKDTAPIFLQFLDCVFQIMRLTPNAFHFNGSLLESLGLFAYSGVFSTFIGDNELERHYFNIGEKTVDIFAFLEKEGQHYENLNFKPAEGILWIPTKPYNLELWKNFYFRFFKKCTDVKYEIPIW
jgi:hypothetical protein